jgi:CheY-like chemotaxis protein
MPRYRRAVYCPMSEVKTFEIPDDMVMPEHKDVLLLEDDPELTENLREILESYHYRVTPVKNGAEGLQKILSMDFDAIVCDMVMPTFPGDMFYLAVQRSRPHLCNRFIFTTGHRANPRIDQFIRGIRGLMIWKPFQMHELIDAIKVVIKKTAPRHNN